MTTVVDTEHNTVRLTRTISAPPAAVYRSFLDPAELSRWFGPGEFRVERAEIDEYAGGRHHTTIVGHNGAVRGTFACEIRELVPDERIVLSWSWVQEHPEPTHPPQAGSVLSITLRPTAAGDTELTLEHSRLGGEPDEDIAGIGEAWDRALTKLATVYLAGAAGGRN